MVASIGAVASPAQGVSYYERDGYYAKEDPAHREASAWVGKGADALGLSGPVDPDVFSGILEGAVPDGSGRRLGRRLGDGTISHRPGRDVTFSASKSVSLAALIGGDERIVAAHDAAVQRALAWIEENVVETRTMDADSGRMVRTGNQKAVIATFTHEVSRNLDPQLHTHAVIANMVLGEDGGTPRSGKWRTMANEKLYACKMLIGAMYRAELARGLEELGYRVEKTHADGRFEIAGVGRPVIEAFSTRRAEIEAAMTAQGLGDTAQDQRLAQRAALMTRAHKREVDRDALHESWQKQAAALGFDARELVDEARHWQAAQVERPLAPADPHLEAEPGPTTEADRAAAWAVAHLSEREAVFSRTDLLTSALTWKPGAVSIGEAEAAVGRLEKAGTLLAADYPVPGDSLTTDRTVADERETIALMERGQGRGAAPMRGRAVDKALRNGPLTQGQKEAVKLILSEKNRVVGVQGFAGTGKTTMLKRARSLLEKRGFEVTGLAPSASAARTLDAEAGIASETLQGFLARNAGVAEGRLSRRGERAMKAQFKKAVLVVDEGSLASTVQTRDLLRIANALRIPRVVLVGDEKQLDAVDAGKPFAQLQAAGMKCVVMDEIVRQREPALKEAVEASLAGDIGRAFEKLGDNVAEVKADNLAGAAAARWLALSAEERQATGLMAPSHALRERINAIVRERLIRDGSIDGPAVTGERLVSRGYTNAEKALAANYAPGDVVAFHRRYKRLGVDKGDELRVASVDRAAGVVTLQGKDGATVTWEPARLAARRGGVEVHAADAMELRRGDRVCWTRNDMGHGLMNCGTAEVTAVGEKAVSFRLEDGRALTLRRHDPQLRHIDRAWAATVHAFQGRTVDRVIAAMEAEHAHLTTQKTFYVEISRARLHAELVTDDRKALCERLEAATGERIAALEAIAPSPPEGPAREARVADAAGRKQTEREAERATPDPGPVPRTERGRSPPAPAPMERSRDGEPTPVDRRPVVPARPRREKTHEVELDL